MEGGSDIFVTTENGSVLTVISSIVNPTAEEAIALVCSEHDLDMQAYDLKDSNGNMIPPQSVLREDQHQVVTLYYTKGERKCCVLSGNISIRVPHSKEDLSSVRRYALEYLGLLDDPWLQLIPSETAADFELIRVHKGVAVFFAGYKCCSVLVTFQENGRITRRKVIHIACIQEGFDPMEWQCQMGLNENAYCCAGDTIVAIKK